MQFFREMYALYYLNCTTLNCVVNIKEYYSTIINNQFDDIHQKQRAIIQINFYQNSIQKVSIDN